MNSTVARLMGASLLLATVQVGSQTAPVEIDDYREFHEHLVKPQPDVTTPWIDLTRDHDVLTWTFHITIDERGVVRTAQLESGDARLRDEARRAALSTRFEPFVRNGQPVVAWTDLHVRSRAADYLGPADRTFPAEPDLSQIIMSMKRTQCYGACPSYRVELRGDGAVRYHGEKFVLVKGWHQWRVDPATILPLLELFRRADYFKLDGYYEYLVTDMPTYVTRLSIGGQHKFVLDYGNDVLRDEEDEELPVPRMPPIVTEIEDALDRISGATGFVFGDETTLQRLREANYDFRSKDAGRGLRMLLSNCKTTLATEFIRAGAPLDVRGEELYDHDTPPIVSAAYCADLDLARLLIDKGALKQPSVAKEFLWSSVGRGQPRLVEMALGHYRDVNAKNEDGRPLLSSAVDGIHDEHDPGKATFDAVKVIDMLIDAGADPNARDAEGRTPIFEANTAATVAAILRRGADIDAVDSKGKSAIEEMTSEEGTLALVTAGAKLPTDPARLAAMVTKASERKWAVLLERLETAAAGH